MGTTPLTFTGVSTFSNDFQSILTRANSIAQIPITALQNQQANILSEKQLVTSLESAMSDLTTSVTNLGTLGSTESLQTTSSDPSVVVDSSTLTTPASYAITNITSVATAASETSLWGYADADSTAVSTSGTFRLVIGGTTYPPVTSDPITLDAAHNNLNGLSDAINALGAGVTATVLSSGSGATPYYLSISANSTGANAIQLVDQGTSANVMTSLNPGANADFDLNGLNIVSPTNVISNAVPGLVFTIAGQPAGNQPVTISAASDSAALSSALQDFVTKYNAVETQLTAQIGPSAGLLTGNDLIYGIQSEMRDLLNYNGASTGTIQNLTDLGIEMDKSGNGTMSLNQTTFDALTPAQISGAWSFLGSATTGFGGLSANLSAFSDPILGEIQAQQTEFDTTYENLNDTVNNMTAQATAMQTTLIAKLQAADTLCASLQSEQQMLSASIQSLNFSSFGYSSTNSSTFTPTTDSSTSSSTSGS